MPFGWLGPFSFKTKNGGRVSIFGLFLSLPFAGVPLLHSHSQSHREKKETRRGKWEEAIDWEEERKGKENDCTTSTDDNAEGMSRA